MKHALFPNETVSQIAMSPVTATLFSPYAQMLSLFLKILKIVYFEVLGSYFIGTGVLCNKQAFEFNSLRTSVIVAIMDMLYSEHLRASRPSYCYLNANGHISCFYHVR